MHTNIDQRNTVGRMISAIVENDAANRSMQNNNLYNTQLYDVAHPMQSVLISLELQFHERLLTCRPGLAAEPDCCVCAK